MLYKMCWSIFDTSTEMIANLDKHSITMILRIVILYYMAHNKVTKYVIKMCAYVFKVQSLSELSFTLVNLQLSQKIQLPHLAVAGSLLIAIIQDCPTFIRQQTI